MVDNQQTLKSTEETAASEPSGSDEQSKASNTGLNLTQGSLSLDALKQITKQFEPVLSLVSNSKLIQILKDQVSIIHLVIPLSILGIIVLLLIPLPVWALDTILTMSFAYSAVILMTVLFIDKPINLNSFPTLILIAAMLRLSLNVASTRLILSDGHQGPEAAGQVIAAFGRFMAGGNYVIGLIVFGILVIINFVVITKGAGRIAEVAARFTLDAMPGKQLAIDADLSAGLINEDEARTRRSDLDKQSNFFGSMDGASKFVRGDAVAGILITLINVIGGVIIGTVQQNLSISDAIQTYTLLTVGDGLVSQIPALVVSLAAGLLVTKSSSDEGQLNKAVFKQLGSNSTGLAVVCGLLFAMATLPGLPGGIFSFLGAGAGLSAFIVSRKSKKEQAEKQQQIHDQESVEPVEEHISTTLQLDQLRLELGYSLLPLVNEGENILTDQIRALRRQMALDFGFVMPAVRIQDNLELAGNLYIIRIKEIEVARGTLHPDQYLVIDSSGEEISIPGKPTKEPTYGLPAMWITVNRREEAVFAGYTVVDCTTVLTTHLSEIVREHMSELLSYAETQKLLAELPEQHQSLVKDLVPEKISNGALQRVLQILLEEKISIRDMPTILEGVIEAVGSTQSIVMISEHVRMRLSRQICESHANDEGILELLPLSGEWEQAFSNALTGQGEEKQMAMPPSQTQEFVSAVKDAFVPIEEQGKQAVMLTSAYLRPYVRSILERFRPQTTVMSQNEVHPRARIRTVGVVRMADEK